MYLQDVRTRLQSIIRRVKGVMIVNGRGCTSTATYDRVFYVAMRCYSERYHNTQPLVSCPDTLLSYRARF